MIIQINKGILLWNQFQLQIIESVFKRVILISVVFIINTPWFNLDNPLGITQIKLYNIFVQMIRVDLALHKNMQINLEFAIFSSNKYFSVLSFKNLEWVDQCKLQRVVAIEMLAFVNIQAIYTQHIFESSHHLLVWQERSERFWTRLIEVVW